jgi:hypothetical protein
MNKEDDYDLTVTDQNGKKAYFKWETMDINKTDKEGSRSYRYNYPPILDRLMAESKDESDEWDENNYDKKCPVCQNTPVFHTRNECRVHIRSSHTVEEIINSLIEWFVSY